MDIVYKRDDHLEYKDDILSGLVTYNKAFAGDAPSSTWNIYVFDNGKLVGACHTEEEWHWLHILSLFYHDQNILKVMMNELYKHYRGHVEGIIFECHIEDRILDFKSAGFETLGIIDDKPIGFDTHVLINREQIEKPVIHRYTLEVSNEIHETYGHVLRDEEKKYNRAYHINELRTDIEYVAFDKEQLVGGVFGYIMEDYLCVSLLWVAETYRGNQIATKLMDLIENEALEKGCYQFYLETCTFQAVELYEKRGYDLKFVVNNCPIGYDDHRMIKKVLI